MGSKEVIYVFPKWQIPIPVPPVMPPQHSGHPTPAFRAPHPTRPPLSAHSCPWCVTAQWTPCLLNLLTPTLPSTYPPPLFWGWGKQFSTGLLSDELSKHCPAPQKNTGQCRAHNRVPLLRVPGPVLPATASPGLSLCAESALRPKPACVSARIPGDTRHCRTGSEGWRSLRGQSQPGTACHPPFSAETP